MRFRLALISLAATGLALGIFFLRKEYPGAVAPPMKPELPPVEERMRDAIVMPALPEKPEAATTEKEPPPGPRIELSTGKLDWEATIESITTARDLSDTAKSRRLLMAITTLPEPALTTAAEEAVRLLPDADYNSVALPLVANPQTNGAVESVLFANLMERPDAITLPALLRIARTPDHPYAKFARDNLDLLVGEDFGLDWQKWEAAVQKALAGGK